MRHSDSADGLPHSRFTHWAQPGTREGMSSAWAPTSGTVEHWAWQYVTSTSLAHKLRPPEPPALWEAAPHELRVPAPGRPAELKPREKKKKTPSVKSPARRAEVLHTFLHHELQAAELMAWAILAFPHTPMAFRRGLLGICRDEIRHLQMYAEHLETLGYPFGSFTINDWFWKRVPAENPTPAHFVARMAIAFEGANLDHGPRFTQQFAEAGDVRAAEIQAQIVAEEVAHTAFGLHWFEQFTGDLSFDSWRLHLPGVISPVMARWLPLNRQAREKAGYPVAFLDALERWSGPPVGGS